VKRHAPATQRNAGPIADMLERELPATGVVLEVASGTGEHAVFMARRFPQITWQPSDLDVEALASIDAYAAEAGLANLLPAVVFDAARGEPPVAKADALVCINMYPDSCDSGKSITYDTCVCINMVHISEWAATVGLFSTCATLLADGAPLVLYGPYIEDEVETAASNLEFDRSLKARNPEWGLRNVTDMDRLADQWGFCRTRRVEMPANNLALVYRAREAEADTSV